MGNHITDLVPMECSCSQHQKGLSKLSIIKTTHTYIYQISPNNHCLPIDNTDHIHTTFPWDTQVVTGIIFCNYQFYVKYKHLSLDEMCKFHEYSVNEMKFFKKEKFWYIYKVVHVFADSITNIQYSLYKVLSLYPLNSEINKGGLMFMYMCLFFYLSSMFIAL